MKKFTKKFRNGGKSPTKASERLGAAKLAMD